MQPGKINKLTVLRPTPHGFILTDENEEEILLPHACAPKDISSAKEIEVFVYKDSKGRPVATAKKPYITLGSFAFLKVSQVNKYGAFLDWGLPKELLVPFSEQNRKMKKDEWHVVILLNDEKSDRLYASSKIHKFLQYDNTGLSPGDEVEILVYSKSDLGYNAIVDNKYKGLIFFSDIHKKINIGDKTVAYVKNIRDDGKIDLVLEPVGFKPGIEKNTALIMKTLEDNNGFLSLTDKTAPEVINDTLGISKKAFKKAIGVLYKQKKIRLLSNGIESI